METITFDEKNNVAYLTITSPPANALSSKLINALDEQLDRIEKEDAVKAIVLKGEGRFFSAGADIKEFTSLRHEVDYQVLSESGQAVFNKLENFPIPVIAAIHGAALGGGLELAMACHIRLATEHAKLGLPEITLGIIPGFAGTQRLPRYVGAAKAYEMMLSGKPITGKEAYNLGLVNRIVNEEELNDESTKLAENIARMSKPAIKHIMHLVLLAKNEPLEKGVKEEAKAFRAIFGSEDAKEGIQAFLEKREPNFKDK
ncbi:enoyl-CoA hydratase [Oceanobacillus bengalensis]|uniref:Enoyl-CoA hydratase n=1 Tax=Oceanobacillus bengalensis TaxID=1435466 RepID=A0A494Z616_9BACI|nr:enoyl-CoA hydratase [Oceanobacillus bengalensis]RKQ17978.1 enoyl-CoA hydratase [Oceanobacillus bengalensis]